MWMLRREPLSAQAQHPKLIVGQWYHHEAGEVLSSALMMLAPVRL